ncbi:MAG: 1,6-anhydro-N-acetylmuramyl-L-alanine amidase AmpD [Gammaproteobacteria bacterium]|nr:1,6-anhydro-N-acetylmuramyl-L-alanine amidase AmpD [Gammaproteobacteria bacterium]
MRTRGSYGGKQYNTSVRLEIDSSGWLENVRREPSPNHDMRPNDARIELIVVHAISLPPGQYGGPWIERLFCNDLDCAAHPYFSDLDGLAVSAHLLIRRDGRLIQFVPFTARAWHAGQSVYGGREACNDFSIGIELEGDDDTPFNPAQYRRLAVVCALLQKHYPHIGDIVGHSDIAPGRKTDPGPHFDWSHLRQLLNGAQ